MAKITCPNCGHRNKPTDSICMKCGSFLEDTGTGGRYNISEPVKSVPVSPEREEEVKSSSVVSGETIVVKTRGSLYRFLPIIIYGAFLGLYYVLINYYSISVYYFLPVLLVVFLTPQLTRKILFPVKFKPMGFNILHNGSSLEFLYSNIDDAIVKVPQRGIQMVTLSLEDPKRDVTFDFDQMFSLRLFLNQLNRRRIPIRMENAPAQS